jgi:hypothetical protein
LNLDLKQFTLIPNLNEDLGHEKEEENIVRDEQELFLQYDKQQVILAQIASFDKASHR